MNANGLARVRGFTLIEVVVAMANIVVVLAGLFFQINRVADTSVDLRQRTLAQWIALNRVTDLRLNGVPPVGQKTEGKIDYATQKWRWKTEILPTAFKEVRIIRASVALESAPKDTWITTVDGYSGTAVLPPGVGGQILWQGSPTGAQGGGPSNGQPGGGTTVTPTPPNPPSSGGPTS